MKLSADQIPSLSFRSVVRFIEVASFALIPILGILQILRVPQTFGITLTGEQYLGIIASAIVFCTFLSRSAEKPTVWMWVHLFIGVLGSSCWLWMVYNYNEWLFSFYGRTPDKWIPAIFAVGLLLEALRRAAGNAIFVLIGLIAAYGFFGHYLIGIFEASQVSPTRLIMYLYTDANGIPGSVFRVASTVVVGFIIFGSALHAVGGTEVFTDIAMSLMGKYRGGAGKASVIGSSLMGTVTGSTVGNVMSTGVVTIPLMKKSGFPPHYAAAVESVSSNGGQIAPPVMGAAAFLMAEFLQISYAEVVTAAIIPAAIYYLVVFLQIDQFAKAFGLRGLERHERPRILPVLKSGWIYLLPFVFLIWLLFVRGYSPGLSAIYSAAFVLALDFIKSRSLRSLSFYLDILISAGKAILPVLLISAGAGVVIGVINLSGLGFSLTLTLATIGETAGLFVLLLITAALSIVFGMGMPTAGVYILLSVLLAPSLTEAGVTPIAAHLFILYFGILSMLTPPVAVASYAAASIAGSSMWITGFTGVRLAIIAYLLPFIFVVNPALIGAGSPWDTVVSIVTVVASGYFLAVALTPKNKNNARETSKKLGYLATGILLGSSSLWLV